MKPRLIIRKRNGRALLVGGDWNVCSCSRQGVENLHETVAKSFGRSVARQVVNQVCLPPFQLRPLYGVGTARRRDLLAQAVESCGSFVAGRGWLADCDLRPGLTAPGCLMAAE